jgi:hypothetical protein
VEIAETLISTRPLKIIYNRSGGNVAWPGKLSFSHFQRHFRGHEGDWTGGYRQAAVDRAVRGAGAVERGGLEMRLAPSPLVPRVPCSEVCCGVPAVGERRAVPSWPVLSHPVPNRVPNSRPPLLSKVQEVGRQGVRFFLERFVSEADLDARLYEPVGQCIYCGSTKGLTDEHIFPKFLWGRAVLPKASCECCRRLTSAFELTCARFIFGRFRVVRDLPTDHPKIDHHISP